MKIVNGPINIQIILNNKSFQVAFTASLVFLVAAFPPLFKNVDRLLAKGLGKRIGSNYYTVLLIHAVIVGVLMFLFTSYILKPVYHILTTHDVAKSDKQSSKPKKTLENFTLNKSDITAKGRGDKSVMSKKFDSLLLKNGWIETNFDLTLNVQKNKVQGRRSIPYGKIEKIEFPTHSIDAFRNKIGVEVEWNNKTEFYDRDLGNFRLLNELKILDVGIIITRCDSLQQIFNKLGKGVSYGSSTTILSKCVNKADSGRAGACPLMLFGISNKLYRDEK